MNIILIIVAVILLLLHWKGPNAVWGGAGFGAVIGVIISLISGNWDNFGLAFAIGTIVGTVFEWIYRLSRRK